MRSVTRFRADLVFRYESPDGMVSYAAPNQSPNVFVRPRATKSESLIGVSGSDRVAKIRGTPLP